MDEDTTAGRVKQATQRPHIISADENFLIEACSAHQVTSSLHKGHVICLHFDLSCEYLLGKECSVRVILWHFLQGFGRWRHRLRSIGMPRASAEVVRLGTLIRA